MKETIIAELGSSIQDILQRLSDEAVGQFAFRAGYHHGNGGVAGHIDQGSAHIQYPVGRYDQSDSCRRNANGFQYNDQHHYAGARHARRTYRRQYGRQHDHKLVADGKSHTKRLGDKNRRYALV